MPLLRRACLLLAASLLALPAARAQTPDSSIPLNDTGQTLCYDDSAAMTACDAGNTGDGASYPRQDGRFGRDAQATVGTLGKTGGGGAGFDFTPLAMDGSTIGIDNDGKPVDTHACVKDNVTGLVWSTHTFKSINWSYAKNSAPTEHNDNQRCGFNDWRVPTRRELLSIVHYGKVAAPTIDVDYFPDTALPDSVALPDAAYFTSNTDVLNSNYIWVIKFNTGEAVRAQNYSVNLRVVRLVRSEQ